MRRLITGLLALTCMASTAWANDTPSAMPANSALLADRPPLSIWRIDDGGSALHLQSGLVCPPHFQGYQRTGPKELYGMHVYDVFGLDVSCNYLNAGAGDLTVYLTLRAGSTVANATTEAQRELLQVRADMHPKLVSESHKTVAGLDFDVTLYDVDGGRDTIWMADLDGWTLEYRLTYRADLESQALSDAAKMTELVEASAGRRLAACAKASPPDRTGVAAAPDDHSTADALIGAVTAAAAFEKQSKGEAGPPPRSILWCPERTGSAGKVKLIFWHGVYDDGSDAGADQMTAMTDAEPVALVAASDPEMAQIDQELKRPARWQATVSEASGGRRLYGFFTARPTMQALGDLYIAVLTGQAHALSAFDPNGRKITISTPAK